MTIQDPISDLFTKIRNALLVEKDFVETGYSKILFEIANVLKVNGFINDVQIVSESLNKQKIKITLKYFKGSSVITNIERKSKPSKRIYLKKTNIPKVLSGYGISILSTSKGILSGKDARIKNVGGELLGVVW